MSSIKPPQNSVALLMILLSSLLLMGSLSIDLYIPYVPLVSRELGCSFTDTQLTLTIPMLMMGLTQMFWGRSVDHLGLSKTLILSLSFYFFGSLICWQTDHINLFLVGRAFQGVGACGAHVFAIYLARLKIAESDVSSFLGKLMGIAGAAPIFAPFLSLAVTHYIGSWKGIFFVLAAYVAIIGFLFAIFYRKELLKDATARQNQSESTHGWIHDTKEILANNDFRKLCLTPCLMLLGLVLFFSFSTFYLQHTHQLDDLYFRSILSGHAVVYVLSSFFLTPLMAKNTDSKITFGLAALLAIYSVLYISSMSGDIPLSLFLICVNVMSAIYGAIYGPSIQNALRSIKVNEGLATSILGMMQFSTASIVTTFAFSDESLTISSYVLPLMVLCSLSLLMMILGRQRS